jgi:arsenate reductase
VLVDLTRDTPTAEALGDLWSRSGVPIKKFFNTSGQSYRGGGYSERLPKMSEAEALKALAADGMLIKRPILDTGGRVFVGFREKRYDL